MKKVLSLVVCLIMTLFATVSAESKTEKVVENVATEAVSTVYGDSKSAIDTVYHDGKSVVKTIYNDSKEFLKDAYPEVKEALISIGKAIGCAAEHVYKVLVKKYFIDGLTEALFCLFGLVLLVIGWVKMEKYVKNKSGVKIEVVNNENCKVYEDLKLDWRVCYPLAFVACGIIMLSNVNYSEMMVNLLNPEWNAINYIVEFTKTMIH